MINRVETRVSDNRGLRGPSHKWKQSIPLKREGREIPRNVGRNELEAEQASVVGRECRLTIGIEFRKDLDRKRNV